MYVMCENYRLALVFNLLHHCRNNCFRFLINVIIIFLNQASPLKHAKDLSEFAQKWANHLVATNSFQHSNCDLKGERLGENIAMKWSSQPDAYTGK